MQTENNKTGNDDLDKIIKKEAEEFDKSFTPDEKTLKEEAEAWYISEQDYTEFKKNLRTNIAQAYATIFCKPDEFMEERQQFLLTTLLHRDQRLYTIEQEKRLEDTILEYAVKESTGEKLGAQEKHDYHLAKAVVAMNKALDEPEQKRKYFNEAKKSLQIINKGHIADSIELLYDVLLNI